jgi:DNA-binding NtrC family response regulator
MNVLYVEDDRLLRRTIARALRSSGCEVAEADSKQHALDLLASQSFDVQLVDVRLGSHPDDRSGLDVVAAASASGGGTSVVLTGALEADIVREAMRKGVLECLPKGGLLPERVLRTLRLAKQLGGREQRMSDALARLLGESPAMTAVRERIARYATRDQPVIITGPSGTGKDLVARALHELSGRPGPLVPVNTAALGGALFESALFGHRRGAFTGAHADREGFLDVAATGTLFLDEIGDLGLAQQASLLRVLQNRVYTPVGCAKEVSVRARVVVATHRDLSAMVRAGTFREDLLSRLDALRITLPALASRREDIAPIAGRFANFEEGMMLSDRALDWLTLRQYTTNVRELQNVITRAAAHSRGGCVLEAGDFAADESGSAALSTSEDGTDLRSRLQQVALREIECAMAVSGGNRSEAARALGVNRQYVDRCLKRAAKCSS